MKDQYIQKRNQYCMATKLNQQQYRYIQKEHSTIHAQHNQAGDGQKHCSAIVQRCVHDECRNQSTKLIFVQVNIGFLDRSWLKIQNSDKTTTLGYIELL